jgi:hypothetical protein
MAGRIDMGPGMVTDRQVQGFRAESRGAGALDLVVIVPDADRDPGMRRVDRHALGDLTAEVDQPHGASPSVNGGYAGTTPKHSG